MNQYPAGLAALTASPYADSDVMNVRMTPREVAGLQQLAMSYGANEQDLYDPVTGQPKFSFLKKILPMIAGAVLPGIPGVGKFAETIGFGSQALGTALIVGGATGLIEGDLKKGLMAGLGAYSGAKIGEGLSASASKVGGAVPAPATESTVTTAPAQRFTQDFNVGEDIAALTAPPPAPVSAPITPIAPTTPAPSTGFFGTMGQGISGLMKPEGRTAFMEALGGPISKSAVFMGAVDALTPTPKPFPMGGAAGEDIVYIPGGFNPQYGVGRDQPYQLPGQYYKRTPQGLVPYNPFQLAPRGRGFATGGSVQAPDQNMNQQRALPHQYQPYPFPNQNYPLSTVMQANYQSNAPQQREVISGYEAKIDPYTGEERFAEGGMVPGGPETFTPINVSPYASPTTDPNVLATRAYIEELNRRARTPYTGTYPGTAGSGLGGFGTPGTYQPDAGGTVGGGDAGVGGGLGAVAGSIAANYLINKGVGAGVDYLKDKFFSDPTIKRAQETPVEDPLKGVDLSTLPTTTTALGALSPFNVKPPEYSIDVSEVPDVSGVPNVPTTTPPINVGGDLSSLSNILKAQGPIAGLESVGTLGGLSSTGFGAPLPVSITPEGVSGLGSLSSGLAKSGSIASQFGGMRGALDAGAGLTALPASALEGAAGLQAAGVGGMPDAFAYRPAVLDQQLSSQGLGALKDKLIPGVATALGAYNTAKAIEAGKEGQAALSAATTAASAAKLFNIGALGGPAGMLAAAALAAIGASMVNTKEYGDVALRNYWNAVDAGRGIGQTDPNELAQGFINFYRTNKNNFAGQEKYGRTGNEDFVYDMTQVINDAVKEGKVDKDVDAATMYQQVVQPWLNSMGSGPQDKDAKRIQDFMMTDLINSFMQGKPISNAQVKGDKKFKIVSEKPVYAGAVATPPASASPFEDRETVMPVGGSEALYESLSPFGYIPNQPAFAAGGAIGEEYNFGFAGGGATEYLAGGKLLKGPGDGMSDDIPAVIRGKGVQRAALADGEFVIPADVVSHLGNGSTNAGAKKLYAMMDKIRQARTGKTRQAPAVKTDRYLPA